MRVGFLKTENVNLSLPTNQALRLCVAENYMLYPAYKKALKKLTHQRF